MHFKYANVSNVAHNIFSIIPHAVSEEPRFSVGQDVIGWRYSKTRGETICEKFIVWQSARANTRILEGDYPASYTINTENDSEMKILAEERALHRMAKVHNFWRCGRVAKTYLLHRRHHTLKTCR